MAEAHVVAICVAVAALALAAAVLGVVGEATKSKSYVRYDGVNCVYRRTPEFGCGIAGAAAVLAGQVVVTAATGCWDGCRSTRSDHSRVAVVFSSVLSWFLATVSATAFLVGALRSQSGERRPREDDVATYYRCTVLVAGVFAGASFLALLAAAVGIASYVALEAAASSEPPRPPCWEERRLGVTAGQLEQGQRAHVCPSYGSDKTMLELFEDEAAWSKL